MLIGLIILVLGAELIIRGSVSFGKKLKVSLFAIGIVIIAGGTSLPELASSINAVVINHSDLAVGAVKVTTQSELTEALEKSCVEQMKGTTTFIEVILNQELGEPFRRDAMKAPVEVAGIDANDTVVQ